MSQIEKATLAAEFEFSLVEDKLQLTFSTKRSEGIFCRGDDTPKTNGMLEILIAPQETSDGLKLIALSRLSAGMLGMQASSLCGNRSGGPEPVEVSLEHPVSQIVGKGRSCDDHFPRGDFLGLG